MITCSRPVSAHYETDRPCSFCGEDIMSNEVSSKFQSTSEDGHTCTDHMHQACLIAWKEKEGIRWVL